MIPLNIDGIVAKRDDIDEYTRLLPRTVTP
jgi:hypothetical protein